MNKIRSRAAGVVLGALALIGWSLAVVAQVPGPSWGGQASDNGSLIVGVARLSDFSLSVECTAPSPRGLPLMQTGSHEIHRTGPFEALIGFGDQIFDWQAPYLQRGAVLIVGETSFRLPDIELNELQGTALMQPMTSPLIQALYSASTLALRTPQGVTHRFPVAGLAAAMDTAFVACIGRWVALGHAIPAAMGRYRIAPAADTAPQPAPAAGIPRFAVPRPAAPAQPLVSPATPGLASLPATILAQVHAICGGRALIAESALRAADDFDADGVLDYVINHADVTCPAGPSTQFCGAANCMIQVFMSSKGYAYPFEFLAIDVEPTNAPDGRRGLRMHATPAICSDGSCDGVWLWDGQDFRNR